MKVNVHIVWWGVEERVCYCSASRSVNISFVTHHIKPLLLKKQLMEPEGFETGLEWKQC